MSICTWESKMKKWLKKWFGWVSWKNFVIAWFTLAFLGVLLEAAQGCLVPID